MTGERRAPEALIIAGPNGAGKTTASRVVVPTDIGFINADWIAAELVAGGHDVPVDVVQRRWRSGLRSLFAVYLDLVDAWTLTDNSDKSAVLVADGRRGRATAVHDRERFAALRRLSRL